MPRTNEENADDSFLIPANSPVSIRRVPGMPRFPIVTGEKNPGSKRAHHPSSKTLKKKAALIAMILNLTLIPCRKPYQIELTTGISKTCGSTSGSSFGGNIPPEVLNFAEHCARKKIVADDPLPNKTLRDAINRIVYHSGNPSSENSGTSFQVRDVASAASKDDPRKPLLVKESTNNSKESTDNSEESCNSDTESTTDVEESSDSAHDMEEKSKKILQEMETISREVQESEFYSELHKQIKSEEFQSQFSRVLASHSHDVPMVIYALGSLEEGKSSKYQLAIALLLQQDFFNWITSIEVFDPVLSPTDIIVLEKLGCTVLTVNEDCERRVERPTLFFMPYVPKNLIGNLLEANWSPSNIHQVILLTNKMSTSLEHYQDLLQEGERYSDRISFKERMEYLEAIQKCIQEIKINGNFVDIFLDDLEDVTDNALVHLNFAYLPIMTQMQYLEAIQKYTEEIGIRSLGESKDNLLYNFAFHFFNVAPEIDMQTLLQGDEEIQLKFDRQFDKLWKKEEEQMVAIIEELIIEAWNDQMAEIENAL
ncbi:hypothetical protein QUC31_002389 [Theobroma cacao]